MPDELLGRPFQAELHDTDVSTATAVPIYEDGATSAYTLADDEYLEIHHVYFNVTEASGDGWIAVGADGTPAATEYVVRGGFDALSGVVQDVVPPHVGPAGGTLWVKTTNAVTVDVKVRGTIRRKGDNTSVRPSWKANLKGG